MSIEVVLFVIVGAISVVAAVMMLLSENAVHSALFLILNFICVAFLYVMLDASFLALVQVAVYAGAIMVLFLFVIMLLGAEKVTTDARRFKWMPWVALVLSLIFLITVSVALISGKIDDQEVPEPNPLVRFIHVAPDTEHPLDILLDFRPIATELHFAARDEGAAYITEFTEVEPDTYDVTIHPTGTGPIYIASMRLTLEAGKVYTFELFGEGNKLDRYIPQVVAI